MPPDSVTQTTTEQEQQDLGRCNSCNDDTIIHHRDSSGEEFCEPCFDEYYTSCDSCNHVIALDDCHYGDDYPYCEDCFYDTYSYCESCGESVHCDYTIWSGDFSYCEGCAPNHREEMASEIEHKRPPQCSRKSETFVYPVRRLVGIEAECYIPEWVESIDTPKYWNNVSDGSISSPEDHTGIEMVSVPMNGDAIVDGVKNLIDWSHTHEANVNRSCGLHVHFDSTDLSAREVSHVAIAYIHFEEMLKAMMPKSRQGSNWCKDFPVPYRSMRSVEDEDRLIDLYYDYMDSEPSTDKYNDARYCGLNIHSRYYHGSIEFRLHSGTLNKTKILNWVSILNMIIIKGVELSKMEDKQFKKWMSAPYLRHMVSTFGVELCSYINKRTNKFKKERENE